uniref:PIH1D1/2/3 CS-like domain-containing protein n=1 Tax=Chrysotila carterae TaxID=13221 RepID=A0A7S4FCQ2_CHRCT
MCQEDGSAATVTDVVVNPDVIGRANHDAGYREELAALATQCVKDVLTEQKLLPHELLPGHLVLAESKKMYAGTPCAFSDVRGRPSRGSDDGDARGVEAMLAANFGGKACPSSLFEQLSSISPFGSEAGMSAFGAAGGAASHGQRSQDDGEVEPSLKIPNDSTLLGAKSADGAAGPARALIEEIASVEALVEEPKYEWVSSGDDGSNLQLRIYLPRVKAGADVDVHASEDAVHLVAEGLYELKLALPVPVLGDGTRCRFLKKSKTMLLTMPTANGVQARS